MPLKEESLGSPERAVLEKWGSEDILYEFLNRELWQINIVGFNNSLSLPKIQAKPEFLSRGIMGEYLGSRAGGDYIPSENERPAEIGIFSSVLIDEEMTRLVLAHEMTHHWDYEVRQKGYLKPYPESIDQYLEKRFETPLKLRSWRSRHHRDFISKAIEVSDLLGIDHLKFLCG